MKHDLYQNHSVSYVIAMICFVMCVLLFGYVLYITPFLFFHLAYDVPVYHYYVLVSLQEFFELSDTNSHLIVYFGVMCAALIFGVISVWLVRRMEHTAMLASGELIAEDRANKKVPFSERYPGLLLSIKLTSMVLFIYLCALWLGLY